MSKANKKQEVAVVVETVDNELENIRNEYSKLSTKSAKIRYLLSLNWTRSKVAKELNIIYQHVRNVEITPIKKQKD